MRSIPTLPLFVYTVNFVKVRSCCVAVGKFRQTAKKDEKLCFVKIQVFLSTTPGHGHAFSMFRFNFNEFE